MALGTNVVRSLFGRTGMRAAARTRSFFTKRKAGVGGQRVGPFQPGKSRFGRNKATRTMRWGRTAGFGAMGAAGAAAGYSAGKRRRRY